MKKKIKIEIELSPDVFEELQDMVQNADGPSAINFKAGGVKELLEIVAGSWADGWRRSGSWEREMLVSMGHVS